MKSPASLSKNTHLDILDGVSSRCLDDVVGALEQMHRHGTLLWKDILYVALQACNDVTTSRRLHSLMVISYLDSVAALGDPLIRLFGSCQSLFEANIVFSRLEQPTRFTWQSVVWTHVILEEHTRTFELYQMQQQHGIKAGKHILSCILKSCGALCSLWTGMLIHMEVVEDESDKDVVVGSCLIDMYAKCCCLPEACSVFDGLPTKNEVCWNVMIAGYAEHGDALFALCLLQRMQYDGVEPGKVTFLCILKVCKRESRVPRWWGRELHDLVLRCGLESDGEVGSALIDIYARCGMLDEAIKLFKCLPRKTEVTWGALISGVAQHGHGRAAVELFKEMQQLGFKVDHMLFSCVLKAIANEEAIEEGRHVHSQVIVCGDDMDTVLGSGLIEMYVRCGSLDAAQKVFSLLPIQNVVTWSTLIDGYVDHGDFSLAFQLFEDMHQVGIVPDKVTFVSMLQAHNGALATLAYGMVLFSYIVEMGFECDLVVATNVLKVLAKCGFVHDLHYVLDTFLSAHADACNEVILSYAQIGLDHMALQLFDRMQAEGLKVEMEAFISLLKSCGILGALSQGHLIHELLLMEKDYMNDVVLGNALLDMYAKCGALEKAQEVFTNMLTKDVVSWVVMMTGYIDAGRGHQALHLFEQMQTRGIEPDKVAFSCALKACCTMGSLRQGRIVHDLFVRSGLGLDVVASNILVNLYGKCGSLMEARKVFDDMPDCNEVSWNSLITGFADHGILEPAAQCLLDMQGHNFKPTASTYSSMFAVCSHVGQVEDGWNYFRSMMESHSVSPANEHFNCMADALARAGFVDEAEELLLVSPFVPDASSQTSLLAACNVHGSLTAREQLQYDG